MPRRRRLPPEDPPPKPRLADLLRASGLDVPEPTPQPAPEAAPAPAPELRELLAGARELVLRKERKGRRGKTVTLLENPPGAPADLKRLARTLGGALGCGSSVDDGQVVLQGNQLTRARAWLEKQGARCR